MIGIICAMSCEVDAMLVHMNDISEEKIHHMNIYKGMIANKEVVIALSGIGKVNAAISTTLLCDRFSLSAIINVGVAGGLIETQKVLDIVVANKVIQHDFDTSPIDGDDGIGLTYHCDVKLATLFQQCVNELGYVSSTGDVASGDSFITLDNGYQRIRSIFPSCVCAEMEAGAIIHVCSLFNVPCLIIRSLSDVALSEGSAMDYQTFSIEASHRAAIITEKFLNRI